MKKQILFFVVVFMTSVSTIVGQDISGSVPILVPRTITCLANDALHPVAGQSYDYKVDIPSPTTGTKSYKWIVTQETTFLTSGTLNTTNAEVVDGSHIAAAGSELNTVTTDPEGKDISITWKTFTPDPAKPLFVVVYVENVSACTTQNVKVYRIDPIKAFTLDIANVSDNGTASLYEESLSTCFSNIVSATYDAIAEGVVYDFGTNYLFFEVTAANFTDSWRPTFRLSGLDPAQSANVDWAYASTPTVWNAMTGGGSNGDYTTTGQVDVKDLSKSVGSAGEAILVRVTVKNQKFEGLAEEQIKLAVDGQTQLALATPDKDLHYATGAQCGLDDGFDNDVATHNLEPRPTINSTTVGIFPNTNPGPFLLNK